MMGFPAEASTKPRVEPRLLIDVLSTWAVLKFLAGRIPIKYLLLGLMMGS